jgi:D-alanyl-D-alanine carboxypeptidase (penicillin-binding protein 5/6)
MKKFIIFSVVFILTFLSVPGSLAYAEEIPETESEGEADRQESIAQEEKQLSGNETKDGVTVEAPSAILMESSTGQVIFEKDADKKLRPASITKIMTLILIFDALASGQIELDDEVVTSAHAKSMGGSQVFLEEGEVQTVETLIKCIVIASGNDASVAMAEYISGTEEEFIKAMNKRAQELGMVNTNFEDCCGLTDSATHLTTARDVAVMSRELITKYPQIFNYSTIWMENITHTTNKGTSEFGLSNTNKLIKTYEGAKGLKTGSTSLAKYCLSAVAEKNGIELISVVMAAPDYKIRFKDAAALLNYGFAKSNVYTDTNEDILSDVPIQKGIQEDVPVQYAEEFKYLDLTGMPLDKVSKEIQLKENLEAPVEKGAVAGKAVYSIDGKEIGSVDIIYAESVSKAKYKDYLWEMLKFLCV